MLTILVACGGSVAAYRLARAARRAEAGQHVRALHERRPWQLPHRLRARTARALVDADVDLEPEAAWELWSGGALVAGLCGFALGPGLALPMALLAVVAAPVALHLARSRARRRYAAAVPVTLEQLAAVLRGGASPAEAIATVGASTGPVASDLRRVTARADLGLTLADALAAWPVDRPMSSVRAAAGALAVAAAVGGRAAPALDGLAASLRERLGAVAEARSLSAQARLSAVVVGAGPIAYLGFTALVDPSSVAALVETGAGRACFALGAVLDVVAIAWMRRIVRADEEDT